MAPAPEVAGYVLAGGRSSRMGRDKALLELSGRTLIAQAVSKLRQVVGSSGSVSILGGAPPGNPALAEYGPMVFDRSAGCGPLGGFESALAHSPAEWSLILPVDVPFLPLGLLQAWVRQAAAGPVRRCEVSLFLVEGVPQPTVALLHRSVAAGLKAALDRREYKLYPVLEQAARQAAPPDVPEERRHPWQIAVDEPLAGDGAALAAGLPAAEMAAQRVWFANLNTPEELDLARAHRQATGLDTLR